MQDRILNPVGIEESLLVIRLRKQSYDAELILREKMKPAKLSPMESVYEECYRGILKTSGESDAEIERIISETDWRQFPFISPDDGTDEKMPN